MAANIYIWFPGHADGPYCDDLEDELEAFFQGAAHDCGAGTGEMMFNLDYEFVREVDPHSWADRLKTFLIGVGTRPGTRLDVFPDGWQAGAEWRRVEIFGQDRRRTDRPENAANAES